MGISSGRDTAAVEESRVGASDEGAAGVPAPATTVVGPIAAVAVPQRCEPKRPAQNGLK
eukprot:CAMPEP_0176229800 /NCGR_PEP_ID=MMETSP0121_2-20121125/23972_1 /TAXON_ID=160619 /ORGANISM="Kryptoperidinium foliaceum, Strain CCMP 1326" /LENGTH=58 /DNA_ID=CAMNT_0017569127 /DNA_START=70 /DNA_END=243 /DNA_ORIENTATION=-